MTTFPSSAPRSDQVGNFDDAPDLDVDRERDQPAYLPTPEQIAAACAEIRAEWTIEERCRRGIGPRRKF